MVENRLPKGLQDKVCSIIEQTQDELIHTFQELVQIPSVVGHEAKAQDYMERLYGDFGLDVVRFEPDMENARRNPGIRTRNIHLSKP